MKKATAFMFVVELILAIFLYFCGMFESATRIALFWLAINVVILAGSSFIAYQEWYENGQMLDKVTTELEKMANRFERQHNVIKARNEEIAHLKLRLNIYEEE